MKRILTIAAAALLSAVSVFAGDAASFDDIGFSADGKYYIFGTYGKTDVNYEPWAEIYTVDVAANEFVKGGVFRSKKDSVSVNASGKEAYEKLKTDCAWKISKYNAKPAGTGKLLYLRDLDNKSSTDTIEFQDFDHSTEICDVFYTVKLVPSFEGSGKNVKSKFYIDVEKKDSQGNVSHFIVGTPDFKRKGITDYKIEKIYTSEDSHSLVFVVQKKLEDDKGTSIRYMVETYRF